MTPAPTTAHDGADLRSAYDRLLVAFHDAVRRPLGVTPVTGEEFYDYRMAEEAEARRPRIGTEDERAERPEVQRDRLAAVLAMMRARVETAERKAAVPAPGTEADLWSDLLDDMRAERDEARATIERMEGTWAPLSDDGKSVWMDGSGSVPLDYSQGRDLATAHADADAHRQRAEAAEAEIARLREHDALAFVKGIAGSPNVPDDLRSAASRFITAAQQVRTALAQSETARAV